MKPRSRRASALAAATLLAAACSAVASGMHISTDKVSISQGQLTADFSAGVVSLTGFYAETKNGETISQFVTKVWVDKNKNGVHDPEEPVLFEFNGSSGTSHVTIGAGTTVLPSGLGAGDSVVSHVEVRGGAGTVLYSSTQPIAYRVQ